MELDETPAQIDRQEAALEVKKRASRPETFADAKDRLSWLERLNIAFIQFSYRNRFFDRLMCWGQKYPGAFWVDRCTRNIREAHGIDRLPDLATADSFILVSNHRSFFDLYVVQMLLFKNGFRRRVLFPVRSSFFYDHPLGFFVNGIMSWFSMYPPIFRDRKRITLNHTAFNELRTALDHGRGAAMHPEGTRKKDDDPYTFLPAQAGIGRAIYQSKRNVIPVFINGLGNNLPAQILGNFTRKGKRIIVVFGEKIDFGDLLDGPATGKTYKAIAEKTLEEIGKLGQEEKAIRGAL